jgi:hypothetical protein
MHHFVRMTAASFLCKDLLLHWRLGQDWFWDTLCDADLAINAAYWQNMGSSGIEQMRCASAEASGARPPRGHSRREPAGVHPPAV